MDLLAQLVVEEFFIHLEGLHKDCFSITLCTIFAFEAGFLDMIFVMEFAA